MATSVVIVSCKKYEQLWQPFFTLLLKYWPNTKYKKYLITDFGKYDGIETIELKYDFGFSTNLILGLDKIKEENIIYFQEDYLATDLFDNSKILFCENYLNVNKNIGCIRLMPCPGPTKKWDNVFLGEVQKGEDYRVSTQTAIWKKSTLLNILKKGESGAQFEIIGTVRSLQLDDIFLSVFRGETPVPYYVTAVTKGIWEDGAIELLKKEGLFSDKITKKI